MADIGPLGFGGTDFSTNFTTDNGSFSESGGVLESTTNGNFNTARCTNVAMDSANHYVQAVIGGKASSNNGAVTFRQASATLTYYFADYVEESNPGGYRLRKIVDGSETDLDTANGGTGAQTILGQADGATQRMDAAGVEVCAASDTEIVSGLYAGVHAFSDNGGRLDDWEAHDLAAAVFSKITGERFGLAGGRGLVG